MPARRRISDYIRYPDRDKEYETRSHMGSEKRVDNEISVEEVAKITAEKVVAEYTRAIKGLLEEISSKLDQLAFEISELNKSISNLTRKIEQGQRRGGFGLKRASRLSNQAKILEEALDKYRVILGSESKAKLGMSPHRLREVADEIGAVIVEAGGDFAATMPEYLEEFETIMKSARTSDPEEAAEKMGVYRRLFEALRKAGLVYYSRACGCWKKLN